MKRNKISSKLIQENERMERRLLVLKELMSAEKTRREVDGGIRWESGQPGLVHSVTFRNPPPPTDLFTAPFNKTGTKRHIKVKFLNEKSESKSEEKPPILHCGQCSKNTASLVCMECKENYCQVCYATMHHKGAMAQHHVRPILNKFRPLPSNTTDIAALSKENTVDENSDIITTECSTERGGALLDGTYDEQDSAQSFQDALREWRNGRNNVAMETNETPEDSLKKVCTTSGGIQAGEGLIMEKQGVNLRFPETSHISYFEKLVIQRCRESPGTNPFLSNSIIGSKEQQNSLMKEEEEEQSILPQGDPDTPVVSEYNLFYNGNDEDEDDCTYLTSTQQDALMEFTEVITPIEEVQIKDMPSVSNLTIASPKVNDSTSISASDRVEVVPNKPKVPTKHPSSKTKRIRGVRKTKNIKSKRQDMETDRKESRVGSVVLGQLSEGELANSVRQAWRKCEAQDSHKQALGTFFLHGVTASDNKTDHSVKPTYLHNASCNKDFKLGGPIWTPNDSIFNEDKLASSAAADCTDTPTNRLGARSGFTDPYYANDGSDSEPENEREEFICSRLGDVRESIEMALQESRPGTATLYDREDDDEEEMEREQADCDAIESLAFELLASTAEFERVISLSRMLEEDGEEDVEEAVEEEELSEIAEETAGVGVASLDEMEIGMSKIQSDFDLFQRNLMDQDSD